MPVKDAINAIPDNGLYSDKEHPLTVVLCFHVTFDILGNSILYSKLN